MPEASAVDADAHAEPGRVNAFEWVAPAALARALVSGDGVVDGVHMSTPPGGAEVYTGPTGAKITDEGFGYNEVGRPSEFYEATPSSGGYYAVTESWWPGGQLASLSAPGVPTITYNPDTAGRVASISASSGQNPINSVSYFPGQEVKTVTFGSGDSDTYALDANLRLSSYTLDINGQNDTGSLVWNGNNTLKSLAVSDPFATGDTQNCSCTQDDLGRLASVNCGSEWAQTYTPDSFGNQSTTSGGSNPLVANFNGNNQFSSVTGFAPTYDLDGDLLDNPLSQTRNAYAWDAEGHAVTVEGVAQTFDALGRLVQNSQTGEVLWSPAGAKLGTMNGQSAGQEAVALPGNGAAVYAGGALSFYAHADWQGSWRLASTPSRTFDGDEAYGPYGATYAGIGPAAFTGKQVDTPDALYDFPFRFSSPALKRWLSPDPAGLAAVNPADPQTWNAYAYAANQPLASLDPLGLQQCATHNGRCMPTLYGGGGAAADDSLFGPNSDWDVFALMSMDPVWVPMSGTNACIGSFCTPMQYEPGYWDNTSSLLEMAYLSGLTPGAQLGPGWEAQPGGETRGPSVVSSIAGWISRMASCGAPLEEGAAQTALDVVGALPIAGEIAKTVQLGTGLASTGLSLAGSDGVGAGFGFTGLSIEALREHPQLLESIAGEIPVAGRLVSLGAAFYDIYATSRACGG